ncbi:MAG: hypothetical protein BWY71_00642 [Planctomycetes bacterium ADurb.Bin412]|nr:MAG: hypothetical protein BWY71_00642 [Planctomycetes bacterium ADurb.Bin412]
MFRLMNNVRTAILLALLMSIFVAVGSIWGQQGMIMALIFGGLMNVIAYFFSDKIALATMRAQPVTEQEAPELVAMVRQLAGRANLPMPRVCICPQQAPNAFATGRNPKNAVVAVTQGLLQMMDRNELMGVIGHELAHIKHRDILIQTVAATVAGAITSVGIMLRFMPIGGDDRRGNVFEVLAMIILAPIAASLIQLAISRKREYNADSFGAELAGDPMYLARALDKLHRQNRMIPMRVAMDSQKSMFIVQPFSGRDALDLFNTHPSLKNRLRALIGRDSL